MIDLEDFDSPLNHVEFYSLHHSLAFVMRYPVSKVLYELLQERFSNRVLLSYQDNCAFLPTGDIKKTIRDVYMMLREPDNQECGIMLMEAKPSPIYYAIETDFLKLHGFDIPSHKSPFTFYEKSEGADITVTLLRNSIEIKCIDEIAPFIQKLGITLDPLINGYTTNHTLIDEVIYEIYKEMEQSELPRQYRLFKNTKPNFPANFRDAHRAEMFFKSLFANEETTSEDDLWNL